MLISSILYPMEWLKGAEKGLLDVALIGKMNIRGGSKVKNRKRFA